MIEKEGPRSLYLGIAPALTRSVVYGGLRLGLYEPCKHVCSYAFGSTNFAFKLASGIIAGALSTTLTNPMEVLKVCYLGTACVCFRSVTCFVYRHLNRIHL
jgi:hypothetical protein